MRRSVITAHRYKFLINNWICIMANAQAGGEQHLSDILNEIKKQLALIEYGSLEIQVHNGQVVQIERREKKRWEKGVNTK